MFVRSFQVAKDLKRTVGAPVVDEKELVPDVHPAESRAELSVALLERLFFIVKGDHDAQIGPLGLVVPMLLGALLLGAPLLVLLLRGGRRSLGSLLGLRKLGCLVGHRYGIPVELAWS